MPAKLTLEAARKRFTDKGCTLVSSECVGSKVPLRYMCSCGSPDEHTITMQMFDKGIRCKDCRMDRVKATNLERYGVDHNHQREGFSEKMTGGLRRHAAAKKLSIYDVRSAFEADGCELLATEYVNNMTPLDVRFSCGHLGKITYSHFHDGERCSVRECINARVQATSMERFGAKHFKTAAAASRV